MFTVYLKGWADFDILFLIKISSTLIAQMISAKIATKRRNLQHPSSSEATNHNRPAACCVPPEAENLKFTPQLDHLREVGDCKSTVCGQITLPC